MKVINKTYHYVVVSIIFMMLLACEEDEGTSSTVLDTSFIRFSLQTNSNDEPIQFPDPGTNRPELSEFLLKKRDTLKLPVVLSTPSLSNTIEASYEVNFNNIDESEFEIYTRSAQLQFEQNQPSDTIFIVPKTRIDDLTTDAFIDFEITSVSDSSINIGYPNELNPLNTFRLTIGNFDPVRYQFSSSSEEIEGIQGESYSVDISFDQIVNPEDVNSLEWLSTDFIQNSCTSEVAFDFDFSLEIEPLDNPSNTLSYRLEILDNFEDLPANLNVNLNTVEDDTFLRRSLTLIQFFKSGEVPERSGDPASAFYNASDRFHRTYGKTWFFDEEDNECQWDDFQSFTRPVEVEPGSEFDNGSGYHKYKIGFRNTIRNPSGNIIGTNPFNLRRFYDGASVLSPAFTQMESIEFFPINENEGTVSLSIQNLVFLVNDETINIPICGNGTYNYDQANERWEIFLSIITDETEINGNSNAQKILYIYTELVDEDPEPLNNTECATTINL